MTTPHDNPTRYDLKQADDDQSEASLDRHIRGDWVEFGEYETLLEAYRDLCERVKDLYQHIP